MKRNVYEFEYRTTDPYFGAEAYRTDIIQAEDVFTALAKWRNRITTEGMTEYVVGGGGEPDAIVKRAEVMAVL